MSASLKLRFTIALVFAIVYVILIAGFVGWRSDHWVMLGLVVGLLIMHKETYKIVLTLSGFAIFWILYDTLRLFPNYMFNTVHILEPYQWELSWFGVWDGDEKVVLSEWFTTRTSDILSVIAGVSYLLWMPAPMAYAIYLRYTDARRMVDFSYGFLLACIIGFVLYYLYPAAPPWYYIEYGVGTDFTVPGSEGLLADFDRIVGVPIFNGIYAKNGNVFCAIPSLHSAYPALCFLMTFRQRQYVLGGIFVIWGFGVWFAAVYSQHHYVIDVLLGIICAVMAHYLMIYFQRFGWYQSFRQFFIRQLAI